jgi:hypothetical protein
LALVRARALVHLRAQGRFQVVVEQAYLAAVKGTPNLWVQGQVGASLLPRARLGAVPYAVECDRASNAGGALATTLTAKAEATTVTALTSRVAALETAAQRVPRVTAWETSTPTSTLMNPTMVLGKWRRVGDTLEVSIFVVLAAGQLLPVGQSPEFTLPILATVPLVVDNPKLPRRARAI